MATPNQAVRSRLHSPQLPQLSNQIIVVTTHPADGICLHLQPLLLHSCMVTCVLRCHAINCQADDGCQTLLPLCATVVAVPHPVAWQVGGPTCASSRIVRPLIVSTLPSATYTASTAALLPPVPPYSDDRVASASVPGVSPGATQKNQVSCKVRYTVSSMLQGGRDVVAGHC